jgi:hypothetical protein
MVILIGIKTQLKIFDSPPLLNMKNIKIKSKFLITVIFLI